jgi:formylglycine-generating enzyme required for sulfatase activity
LLSTPALAQVSQADALAAESLFREAKDLVTGGKTAEACPKFAESQRLDPQIGTLLYLATCHSQEGKSATAWAEFLQAADQAARAHDEGSGGVPSVPGSGWDASWNTKLAISTGDLRANLACDVLAPWTDTAGANERFPAVCLDWYTAFAFCVWDGGRLATDAEYNFAAAGGTEQRTYPWGASPPDRAHALYGCNNVGDAGVCDPGDLVAVGSRSPLGDGRWGHSDLAGSANEWILDTDIVPPVPCNDCATVTPAGAPRVKRGESFNNNNWLATTARDNDLPALVDVSQGVRCVR